ncbi:mycofactocin biosynthesis chaperone MftB [Streptomyces melanosporofaciens]|uniref:Putative mycofactocin binding protein MftB n=1 Tax=Streptomyces melanosporofaciens TaxID=67327 RepID=A0A1H4IAI4_STRMJ|nr:mycofactocin biosynthesis chaperone MftB [Streptomyces melanosporofaciens]SEB30348.1 putative mycofactocin binding protein MftB [Streptomyces melanosporofaciens]
MACAASTETAGGDRPFDPGRPHRLSPTVSVRPEPFGALVYDFDTRRLSFLKALPLVTVVQELERHPDVHGALAAAGIPPGERSRYVDALAGLAAAGTIQPR